jgi:hypothetical protein
MTTTARPLHITPTIGGRDPLAAYWLGQVHARLRRELAWAWHERGGHGDGVLPAFIDRASLAVDLVRRHDEKLAFFAADPAARYLTERIAEPPPHRAAAPRGSFAWVCEALALAPLDRFWFAIALAGSTDAAVGSVMAACVNDPARTRPTLALAQRLWDAPGEISRLADPAHPLHRSGIVSFTVAAHVDWDASAVVPPALTARLIGTFEDVPASLVRCHAEHMHAAEGVTAVLVAEAERLRVIPIVAARGDAEAVAAGVAQKLGRTILRVRDDLAFAGRDHLDAIATWSWLAGVDLLLPEAFVVEGRAVLPRESIPATIFVEVGDAMRRPCAPDRLIATTLRAPVLDHEARVTAWTTALGIRAHGADRAIAECARRFVIGRSAIERTAHTLADGEGEVTADEISAACRDQIPIELGELAERIEPRFSCDELVLPPPARRAFDELTTAMHALTEVHHGWGTARAWRAAGISALFAGPSGTGKTMAAECLARELGVPLYRVDLSQVVDKYVGETEKNLKRVFDAAERADIVLFLDEAEAVFGRRMETRSAQDRWANLEISYLLTRMESARGLTILATNRKEDFDTAFLRRLRYVVQFPMPDADARLEIWRRCLPPNADTSEIDLEFVARRFQMTGGQIRSVMFNACLQSAKRTGERRLAMDAVVVAIWRELHKHEGACGAAQFGPYAETVRALEHAR